GAVRRGPAGGRPGRRAPRAPRRLGAAGGRRPRGTTPPATRAPDRSASARRDRRGGAGRRTALGPHVVAAGTAGAAGDPRGSPPRPPSGGPSATAGAGRPGPPRRGGADAVAPGRLRGALARCAPDPASGLVVRDRTGATGDTLCRRRGRTAGGASLARAVADGPEQLNGLSRCAMMGVTGYCRAVAPSAIPQRMTTRRSSCPHDLSIAPAPTAAPFCATPLVRLRFCPSQRSRD